MLNRIIVILSVVLLLADVSIVQGNQGVALVLLGVLSLAWLFVVLPWMLLEDRD